ncbi:MAG: YncE family protein [Anaerolineae bacterium]|nr:YncE family protein [Anaerolineae bacterium]
MKIVDCLLFRQGNTFAMKEDETTSARGRYQILTKFGAVVAALACLLLVLSAQSVQAQSGGVVYVANSGSDNISVISLDTSTVATTIPVGDGPSRVVVTPDGSKAYVLNSISQNISVINTAAQAVVTTISVGSNPKSLAMTPDGAKVYVTNPGSNNISVIDTTTDTVVDTVPLTAPDGAACTPDGSELWIGRSGGANQIQIFTLPGNGINGTVSGVIGGAEWTGFLPDGSFAFVNNGCGCCGNLQKISTASNTVVSTLGHSGAGVGIAIAPDGSAVYAGTNGHCGGGGPQVKKINPATNTPIASLLLPAEGPGGMTITPDGNFLYVPVVPLNQVLKVDTATMTVVATISVGTTPVDAAVGVIPADTTPPTISPQISGTLGNNDWYTDDVTVSWTVSDDESPITSTSGCDATIITTDTAGTTFTCEATSAGGTASQNVTIKRDATPPTISGSAAPPPNSNGWNNSDVSVTFTCADDLSGVAACGPDQTLSSEGANQSVTGTATDNAGNSASTTVSGLNLDKTPLTVSVTGVTDGATYSLGQVPAGGCETQDSLSGVATQAAFSLSGGNGVGSFTATCNGASDNADNSNSASVTYQVIYNFAGFFAPVDNPPTVNAVKAGQAIPVKFSLSGNQGLNILESGYPKSQAIACDLSGGMSDIEETVTAGDSNLSYDPSSDQYNYVWKTKKDWAGSCRQFVLRLNDGTEHLANFQFK